MIVPSFFLKLKGISYSISMFLVSEKIGRRFFLDAVVNALSIDSLEVYDAYNKETITIQWYDIISCSDV